MYRSVLFVFIVLVAAVTPARADSVPSQLIGTWEGGYTSTIDFVDPNTGSHDSPSGMRKAVHFYPSGRYEHEELNQVSAYSCETGYFGADEGSFSVDGDVVHIGIVKSRLHQWATCSGRDYWKNIDPRRHSGSLRWRIESKDGYRYLVLTQLNGTPYGVFRFIKTL